MSRQRPAIYNDFNREVAYRNQSSPLGDEVNDATDHIKLYSYWRSSAAYRVRIVLELKDLGYDYLAVDLLCEQPENWQPEYLALNPQGLVPTLEHAGFRMTQSLAIIDYLDAHYPQPRLIPTELHQRAKALSLAQIIGCDVHPLQNPMVCDQLRDEYGASPQQLDRWRCHWIARGLAAYERHLSDGGETTFSIGDTPTVADIYLIPQLFNARLYGCALDSYPLVTAIEARCLALEAFQRAAPEAQPDAP